MRLKKISYSFLSLLLIILFHALVIAEDCPKKYNISVCALFKNDADHLKEWIEYHKGLEIEHFYLYDTGSDDAYKTILQPYIDNEIVTLVHWPAELCRQCEDIDDCKWALASQIPAYENAVNFTAKEETEWLIILDINENLVCSEYPLKDLLRKYHEYSGITCSSFFYDAPLQENYNENINLLKALELKPALEKSAVKMFFKPSDAEGFMWPPYQCRFRENQVTTEISPKELWIDRYTRRKETSLTAKQRLERKKTILRKSQENEFNSNSLSNYNLNLSNSKNLAPSRPQPMYQKLPEYLKKLIHNNKEID